MRTSSSPHTLSISPIGQFLIFETAFWSHVNLSPSFNKSDLDGERPSSGRRQEERQAMGAVESQERGRETNEPGIESYTGWLTSAAWGSDPGADAASQPWFGGPVDPPDQEAVHQAFALVEEPPGPRKLARPRELVFEKPEARKLPGQEAGSTAEGCGALEDYGEGDAFAEVSRGRELSTVCLHSALVPTRWGLGCRLVCTPCVHADLFCNRIIHRERARSRARRKRK